MSPDFLFSLGYWGAWKVAGRREYGGDILLKKYPSILKHGN